MARGWCVKIDTYNNEVVQLLPKGYVQDFPGYLEINIPFRELQGIVNDPNANAIWHKMLSSVGAVYLIVDTKEGKQEGLLGRWKEYAINGHGNNKKLKELIDVDPQRIHTFKYTILQTLPKTLTKEEVLREEGKYKDKLGSRA